MDGKKIAAMASRAEPLGLSFGEVELILQARFFIDAERATAFRGRLQNLQRKGFPAGVNTGKGKPAIYGFDHLVKLLLAFSFIDLGMQPDQASELVELNGRELVREAKDCFFLFDIEGGLKKSLSAMKVGTPPKLGTIGEGGLLVVHPNALGPLKAADYQSPEISILNVNDVRSTIGTHSPFSNQPSLIISMGELVMRMLLHISFIKKWSATETAASFIRWASDYDEVGNAVDPKA